MFITTAFSRPPIFLCEISQFIKAISKEQAETAMRQHNQLICWPFKLIKISPAIRLQIITQKRLAQIYTKFNSYIKTPAEYNNLKSQTFSKTMKQVYLSEMKGKWINWENLVEVNPNRMGKANSDNNLLKRNLVKLATVL